MNWKDFSVKGFNHFHTVQPLCVQRKGLIRNYNFENFAVHVLSLIYIISHEFYNKFRGYIYV